MCCGDRKKESEPFHLCELGFHPSVCVHMGVCIRVCTCGCVRVLWGPTASGVEEGLFTQRGC